MPRSNAARRTLALLEEVRACRICEDALPLGPRPIVQLSPSSRVLVVGQAPGSRVHETGVPFDDPSGERLRSWLGMSRDVFYDPGQVAIVPAGLCFPGSGASGDLPPRPECAPAWRAQLLACLERVELTVVLGRHALDLHRRSDAPDLPRGLTEAARMWRTLLPHTVVLPHPSPRNNRWLARNPWFEAEVVPALQTRVAEITGDSAS